MYPEIVMRMKCDRNLKNWLGMYIVKLPWIPKSWYFFDERTKLYHKHQSNAFFSIPTLVGAIYIFLSIREKKEDSKWDWRGWNFTLRTISNFGSELEREIVENDLFTQEHFIHSEKLQNKFWIIFKGSISVAIVANS